MKNFMTAAFATEAIALLSASPVVADQSADQGAAHKPTLMSDAEMAEIVAGMVPPDPLTLNVPGPLGRSGGTSITVPRLAANRIFDAQGRQHPPI